MTLKDIFVLNHLFKKIDRSIGNYGLQPAMEKIVRRSGATVKIDKPRQTESFLKDGGAVIICNHPAEFEVIVVLAAMSNRSDIYMVTNSSFLNLCGNLDPHLIPVYISNRLANYQDRFLRRQFLNLLCGRSGCSDAHEKNIDSIKLASDKVNQNHLVIIYPEDEHGQWLKGVGYLVSNITNPHCRIIFAYIAGTTKWDYFRLLPFVSNFLPKINLKFSSPYKIASFANFAPSQLFAHLEKQYLDWAKNL